jgi:PPOX class probable F420-dependent enzyme
VGEDSLSFARLMGHQYLRLTTYRKTGEPVPTPVWFALADGHLYVFTDLESGKVGRIRNDPRVTLAPSTFRGRPRSGEVRAEARILDPAEHARADRALRDKYGWRYRLAQAVIGWLGLSGRRAFLALRPENDGGER